MNDLILKLLTDLGLNISANTFYDLIIIVVKTIIGTLISILLAYVAYQNYKIGKAVYYVQKDKLRLDLFDRRYKIFQAVQELLDTFILSGTFTRKDISIFVNNSTSAEFLYGKDVKEYVDEIWKKALRLIHLGEKLKNENLTVEKREEIGLEMEKLELWFSDQAKESKNLFKKYLHFSIDKNP